MTIKELIKELEELPQHMQVVTNYKEITNINCVDSYYVVTKDEQDYDIGPVVVLE